MPAYVPQGLCTSCSLCLEHSSPNLLHGSSPVSFKSLLKCHLLNSMVTLST